MIFAEKLNSTLSTLKLLTLLLTIPTFLTLTACSNVSSSAPASASKNIKAKPSSKELYLVNNPPKEILTKIDAMIPTAMKWYDSVDKALYNKGRALTKAEKKRAKQLGVKNPDAVRVVVLDEFPEPSGHIARNRYSEGGRAMGNIIMIKPHFKNDSVVICHELVHIAQKDRMGLKNFLKQMALEKHILGYSKCLLENEAYALQQPIIEQPVL